eukprot:132619-Pelagomonas_calceolata.AAC.3
MDTKIPSLLLGRMHEGKDRSPHLHGTSKILRDATKAVQIWKGSNAANASGKVEGVMSAKTREGPERMVASWCELFSEASLLQLQNNASMIAQHINHTDSAASAAFGQPFISWDGSPDY